jgi:hypothetical protein
MDLSNAPNEVIFYALNKVIDVLIRKYDELGLRASSEWAEGLEVRIDSPTKGTILGVKYTEQLVNGRESGPMPPVDPIKKWVQNKLGITGKRGQRIAWAVATKIKNEGTEIYKQGGTDLLQVLDDKETMDIFAQGIKEYYQNRIKDELLTMFKKL